MDTDNLHTAIRHPFTRAWLAVASLVGALTLGDGSTSALDLPPPDAHPHQRSASNPWHASSPYSL